MADEKPPRKLLKYYNCSENNLKVLTERKIWAGDPFSFNDPFDCAIQFWSTENFPKEFIVQSLDEILPEENHSSLDIYSLRERYIKGFTRLWGIFCLNSGKQSDLFWGYYNSHKGFAIEFDTKTLSNYWGISPRRVEYNLEDIERPKLTTDRKINTQNAEIWIKTKKRIWEHEEEWRYVILLDLEENEPRKTPCPIHAISRIILGYKFFENYSAEYKNLGIYKHILLNNESTSYLEKYPHEILKHLKDHSTIPLFQVALDENLTLFYQRIYIKEINENTVIVQRVFPPKQLAIMDAPVFPDT